MTVASDSMRFAPLAKLLLPMADDRQQRASSTRRCAFLRKGIPSMKGRL